MTSQEWLRILGLFSSENRRLSSDHIAICNFKVWSREGDAWCLVIEHKGMALSCIRWSSDSIWGKGSSQRSSTEKTPQGIGHCLRPIEYSSSVWTMHLDAWFKFQVSLYGIKSWTQWSLWVPSNSGSFINLWKYRELQPQLSTWPRASRPAQARNQEGPGMREALTFYPHIRACNPNNLFDFNICYFLSFLVMGAFFTMVSSCPTEVNEK